MFAPGSSRLERFSRWCSGPCRTERRSVLQSPRYGSLQSALGVVLTAAAVVLGGSVARNACAQPPIPTGGAQSIREPGPVVPEMIEAGGPQQRTSTGQATEQPVFTPGYF